MRKKITDIGREFRQRNPKYSDLTDEQAGQMVIAARPEIYKPVLTKTVSSLELINPQLENKIQALIHRHDSNMGVFVSWWRKRKTRGQNEYLDEAGKQHELLITQAVRLSIEIIEGRKREVEFVTFIAQHRHAIAELHANGKMIIAAANVGMYPNEYSSWNRFASEYRLKMKEAAAAHERDMEKQRQESLLRTQEKTAAAQIVTDNEIIMAQEELKLAIIADNLNGQQIMVLIQDLIDDQYIKIAKMWDDKSIPASAKPQIAHSRERMIKMFMKQQDETQNRLLQENNRQEV
jgi:hypothetical protein